VVTLGHFKHWGPRMEQLVSPASGGEYGADKQFEQRHVNAVGAVYREKTAKSKRGLLNAIAYRIRNSISSSVGISSLEENREKALVALRSTPGYFKYSVYDRGDLCEPFNDNSISRDVQVTFHCGPVGSFDSVVENEKCRYNAVITTPLACVPAVEAESLDTLDHLGVFGFTRKTSIDSIRNTNAERVERNEEVRMYREKEQELKRSKNAKKYSDNVESSIISDEKLMKNRKIAMESSVDREREKALGKDAAKKFKANINKQKYKKNNIKKSKGGNFNDPKVSLNSGGGIYDMSEKEKSNLRQKITGQLEMDVVESVVFADEDSQASADGDDDDEEIELLDLEDVPDTKSSTNPTIGLGFQEEEMLVGGMVRPKRQAERGPATAKQLGFNVPDDWMDDEDDE
jgi:hypothetical protein